MVAEGLKTSRILRMWAASLVPLIDLDAAQLDDLGSESYCGNLPSLFDVVNRISARAISPGENLSQCDISCVARPLDKGSIARFGPRFAGGRPAAPLPSGGTEMLFPSARPAARFAGTR